MCMVKDSTIDNLISRNNTHWHGWQRTSYIFSRQYHNFLLGKPHWSEAFNCQQQEDIIQKQEGFLLKKGSILIADYGYQEDTTVTTVSCQILSKPASWLINRSSMLHLTKNGQTHLVLPAMFASLLEDSNRLKCSIHTMHWQSKTDWEAIYLLTCPPCSLRFSTSCRYFCQAYCSFTEWTKR